MRSGAGARRAGGDAAVLASLERAGRDLAWWRGLSAGERLLWSVHWAAAAWRRAAEG